MYRAYIKSDPLEDPSVLLTLIDRLKLQGIESIITDKDWKQIWDPNPFLYFRNAYIRFAEEISVIQFHLNNPQIPYLVTRDQELISVSPAAKGVSSFIINRITSFQEPQTEPLPILIGANQRPTYFRLTLNSILANIKSNKQKLYIVVSDPDPETHEIVKETLKSTQLQVEAVFSKENLRYAFCNFGSKFFGLKKLIHFEDDGLLPDHTHFQVPYWPSQMNHRSSTADLVNFRTYEGNWRSDFYVSDFYHRNNLMKLPTSSELWHYFKPSRDITPLGGNGAVIDIEAKYRNFKPPNYNNTDQNLILTANAICMLNIPIYHIGANFMMDYPTYAKNKQNTTVARYQTGVDMRTGQVKKIDLEVDWKDGGVELVSQPTP